MVYVGIIATKSILTVLDSCIGLFDMLSKFSSASLSNAFFVSKIEPENAISLNGCVYMPMKKVAKVSRERRKHPNDVIELTGS
jgi:hypothetical protein